MVGEWNPTDHRPRTSVARPAGSSLRPLPSERAICSSFIVTASADGKLFAGTVSVQASSGWGDACAFMLSTKSLQNKFESPVNLAPQTAVLKTADGAQRTLLKHAQLRTALARHKRQPQRHGSVVLQTRRTRGFGSTTSLAKPARGALRVCDAVPGRALNFSNAATKPVSLRPHGVAEIPIHGGASGAVSVKQNHRRAALMELTNGRRSGTHRRSSTK